MPIMNLFIVLFLMNNVLTNDDALPETPSHFVSNTKLLPEQSDGRKTSFPFQQYVPIACFCDRLKCNAHVESIEWPVIGLLTLDGNMVKTLQIQVNQGELMYIVLIEGRSNVTEDTYLERNTYWRLTDGQRQVLAGVSTDVEILGRISVSILKMANQQFTFESGMKNIAMTALNMSTSLRILLTEELESTATYHYSASLATQVVGVYQLSHELTIHPGVPLLGYIGSQKTDAQCSSYFVLREKCGFLQLLPSFLQRTSVFRQVAVSLATENRSSDLIDRHSNVTEDLITEINEKPKKKDPSGNTKAIIISVSILCILLVGTLATLWYYDPCRYIRFGQILLPQEDPDDNDDQELVSMP